MPNTPTGSKQIDVTELMNSSVLLSEYNEASIREYFLSLAHMYKHAKNGDEMFEEICQGRAAAPAKAGQLFSTCGEWCHFLLERAGYRGPILNRNLYNASGQKTRSWVDQKNINYLFEGGRRAKAFVEYLLSKAKERRPQVGDICYIAVQGKPRTEHVFMHAGADLQAGSPFEYWTSIDGGQGGIPDQHIAEVHRVFDPRNGMLYKAVFDEKQNAYVPGGDGRHLIGWLSVTLLEYTTEANLRVP